MKILKLGTINFEALDHKVKVVVVDDLRAFSRSKGFQGSHSACATQFDGDGESLIAFRPFPSAGIVAHESWHAIYLMLTDAGAALDNEIVAYHLGHLVDKIMDKLHAHIKEMKEMDICNCSKCQAKAKGKSTKSSKRRKTNGRTTR